MVIPGTGQTSLFNRELALSMGLVHHAPPCGAAWSGDVFRRVSRRLAEF